ncbi:MAG: hypothetical protein IH630_02295 [Thermoplasmata archaeon]|nr:hypothetical protein [Thermoplasmata archaeon]TFG70143.1 MAG: hypothetical protein E4H25_02980 [Methanomassiliicoccus sp.]
MEVTTPETGKPVTLEMIYKKLERTEARQSVDSLRAWIMFSSSLSVAFAGLSIADESHRFWWVIFSSFYLVLTATSVILYQTGMKKKSSDRRMNRNGFVGTDRV